MCRPAIWRETCARRFRCLEIGAADTYGNKHWRQRVLKAAILAAEDDKCEVRLLRSDLLNRGAEGILPFS